MRKIIAAATVHLVLLALACTDFTLVSGWFNGVWKCDFYTYRYANGWGYVYRSDYTLPVVITYLIAYATGTAFYALTWRAGSRWVAGAGLTLCIIGLLSFGIEGSHWLWTHNLSWIASFPMVLVPLAVVAACQAHRMSEPQGPDAKT
jgi:hypothetical protein